MRRIGSALVLLLIAALALPPLWYTVFPPPESPPLPPAGQRVVLPSGLAVNVIEKGTGPAVVLAHGLPGTAYDWRVLVDELADRGVRAIAYDRVGYGRSDPRAENDAHSIPANVAELEQLMDALGLDDPTVVGWSYGGAMALTSAINRDSRMARLVLVGTGGPDSADAKPPEGPPGIIRFLYSDPVLAWRSRVPPITRGLIAAATESAFSGQEQPSWWLPSVAANFSRPETVRTYKEEMFYPIEGRGFEPGRIDVPTLLIHGDDDRLAPVAISQYLVSAIPNAEALFIENGSHMLPVTHAPLLADVITTFISNGSGSASEERLMR